MSGWRIGYVIADERLISTMTKLNQHIITCAPSILMFYFAMYMDDILAVTMPQIREVVEKRRRIADAVSSLGLVTLPGSSTFYFFISIDPYPASAMNLALTLLVDHGISVVPGDAYGVSTARFVRISIGTEPEDVIVRSLSVLRDLISGDATAEAVLSERLAESGIPPFEVVRVAPRLLHRAG